VKKFAILVCLIVFVQGIARAEAPANVIGTLGKPENTEKVAAVVGHSGVLFIRSEARWDEFRKLVPDLTPDTPLPKLDFAKQNVVLVYSDSCRSKAEFTLAKSDLVAEPPQLDWLLRWDNGPEDQKEFRYAKFILAVIPATPTVKVTVATEPLSTDTHHLHRGGRMSLKMEICTRQRSSKRRTLACVHK